MPDYMKSTRRSMMDYGKYKPEKAWVIKELIKIIFICKVVGYLFFGNIIFGLFIFPFGILIWKKDIREYIALRRKRLSKEFKEMLISLSGNLNAGYSLERAFYKTYQELIKNREIYKYITGEVKIILHGIECNKRIEDLLEDFSVRSGIEDIKNFSELVTASKIYGGNMVFVIRQTVSNLNEKYLVEDEIDTLIAGKKLEGKIMLLMPFLIILYMKLTNKGYMNVLYNTALGNVVMMVCLVLILISGIVINKIVEIEV